MMSKINLISLVCLQAALCGANEEDFTNHSFIKSFIPDEEGSQTTVAAGHRDASKDNEEEPLGLEKSREEKVIIQNGKGVVLLGEAEDVLSSDELVEIEGLNLVDLCLPGKDEKLNERLEPLYWDKPITWGNVLQIKVVISKFYEENGFPLVLVDIPKQDITEGVLQLVVTPSKVGQVLVEGNHYSNSCKLKKYIKLKPTDPVDQNILIQDLNFMNRNPFRKVDLVYMPGDEPGTTDLVLYMVDRRPYRLYAGVDDTGVRTTGRQRFFTGFNVGGFLGFDDLLSFQFTSGYSTKEFQAYTAQYMIPLPWQHTLAFYGGYSSVHADLSQPGFPMKNHGDSAQASLRYYIPSFVTNNHQGEWGFGGDYKRTNNNLEFTDLGTLFGQNVNLTQLFFGYSGDYEGKKFTFHYGAQLYWSPGKWLPDQSNADYNSLRPGATNQWVFGRLELSYNQLLPGDMILNLMGRGQLTSSDLLPMEQFYIGGFNTVRGYDERQLNYDNGFILNAELRSPYWRVFTRKRPNKSDAIQLLAFFDYGYGRDHQMISGIKKNNYLIGTGPGVRYTYDPFFTARLDWGFKLHHNELFKGGNSMLHFSVIASY